MRPVTNALLSAAGAAALVTAASAQSVVLLIPSVAQEAAAVADLTDLAETGDGVAKLVRFAFHTSFFNATGCIDLDDPENNGLAEITASVDALFEATHSSSMSRADFWALAGVVGARVASDEPGLVTMRYGRQDSPLACVGAGSFPNALGDMSESMATLGEAFGLDERDVTTLLGAHALGRCRTQNSGFNGPWRGGNNLRLDNGFYRSLSSNQNDWEQRVAPAPSGGGPEKNQWERGGSIMLNVDASLYRDLGVNGSASGRSATCPGSMGSCPRAATADVVDEFADDEDQFLEEFAVVFQQMIEKGASGPLQAAGEAVEAADGDADDAAGSTPDGVDVDAEEDTDETDDDGEDGEDGRDDEGDDATTSTGDADQDSPADAAKPAAAALGTLLVLVLGALA